MDPFDDSPYERVVILGHQRSGTSVVARLLSIAAGIRLLDDPPWTYSRHIRPILGDELQINAYLKKHSDDFKASILKAPSLTPVATYIEHVFPNTAFVVVVREPKDNIAAVLEWRRHRDPTAVDDFWDQSWLGIRETTKAKLLAQRWNMFFDFTKQLSKPLWFSYDQFFRNKSQSISHLCNQLGLEIQGDVAPAQDRQFKKNFGDRSIKGAQRWQRDLSAHDAKLVDRICGSRFSELEHELLVKSKLPD